MSTGRRGLLAGGNFIVDRIKTIDAYPAQDTLASILSESISNGGGPYNVLRDLAAMSADYPLEAAGMVGSDADGDWVTEDCKRRGIDTHQLHRHPEAPTSYTDVMSVAGSGRRTFFHRRGANALLDLEHFDFGTTQARIFHFGYLMLLDRFDEIADGVCKASLLLARAREAGMQTSVDFVSAPHPAFSEIARSTLPQVDHLLLNEIEAGMILKTTLDAAHHDSLAKAASDLLDWGVHRSVVIHFEGGAVAATRDEGSLFQASLNLPPGYSQGATGAGDAFAAGYLHGVHEQMDLDMRLKLAMCTAAACLSHASPSGGMRDIANCRELAARYGWRAQ
ncbi:carbohydrate kinase family protein [Luteolibacter sp. Populi]|uniref:carbohydrate kinase family protein n=1 Tax=Luteolibacter sp. Populi TaxID=3230487 RepID=UPI00346755ED